jgi:glycyl-tRNA synthetase
MDDIVNVCKRRGFVFQSSEIYNGFNGFYDYGPLGGEAFAQILTLLAWGSMEHNQCPVMNAICIYMHPSSLSSRSGSEMLGAVCSPVEVKNNIKQRWWRDLVHGRDDMVGLDSSIIMSPKVRVVKHKKVLYV